jgi:hypothetical protein
MYIHTSKCEVLISNPNITKKKKNKRERERQKTFIFKIISEYTYLAVLLDELNETINKEAFYSL